MSESDFFAFLSNSAAFFIPKENFLPMVRFVAFHAIEEALDCCATAPFPCGETLAAEGLAAGADALLSPLTPPLVLAARYGSVIGFVAAAVAAALASFSAFFFLSRMACCAASRSARFRAFRAFLAASRSSI